MKIYSTYGVKIKYHNKDLRDTVSVYRDAVDFFIDVVLREWHVISGISGDQYKMRKVEILCHSTAHNTEVRYREFDRRFYKFPSYLRRAAINEALGKVSSYKTNLANWEASDPKTKGRKPGYPKAGFVYPCMYRENMYEKTDTYEAKIKAYIRNTWDWITVQLRKSDVDYINCRCRNSKECAPTLQKRGHEWYLDFPFEEKATLSETDIYDQTVIAVDLGMNNAATVSVMHSDGTVLDRLFLSLSKEYDSLWHSVNRIKKAQQNGNRKTPRLWAKSKGINDDIAVKTAQFIVDAAVMYNADVIVMEHLDLNGRKRGSKKQRLALWRSRYVQEMVTNKAHRLGMRVSHVCAWGTSRLAFDGSGPVLRGTDAGLDCYSLCRFRNGKVYNCDLSASYNIGSRYFVREILKSLPTRERLSLEAKVPGADKRSTCTLSTLISLNAALMSATA